MDMEYLSTYFFFVIFSPEILGIKVHIHVRQVVFSGYLFNFFNSGWNFQSVHTYIYVYACNFLVEFKKIYCCLGVCVHVCVYVHMCVWVYQGQKKALAPLKLV